MKMQGQELNSFDVHTFVTTLLGNTQHNKRLESLEAKIAMDWTDFDSDKQTTLSMKNLKLPRLSV